LAVSVVDVDDDEALFFVVAGGEDCFDDDDFDVFRRREMSLQLFGRPTLKRGLFSAHKIAVRLRRGQVYNK